MIFNPILPLWLLLAVMVTMLCILIAQSFVKDEKSLIEKIRCTAPKVVMIVLLFIIGLRPMIPDGESVRAQINNLDVLFVIDNTISMNAEDYNGTNKRLDGVKADAQYILEKLSGARFSLITFCNRATIVAPYTNDQNMIQSALQAMAPIDEFYARGSSLNAPIEAINTIVSSAEKKSDDRTRILFFISDGEITDESKLESYEAYKEHFAYGAVLGYGTAGGGKMKSNSTIQRDPYIMDDSDMLKPTTEAISKLDEDNLKKIATDINIDYVHMSSQKEIAPVLKKISELATTSIESKDDDLSGKETYYLFAIPLLLLLFAGFNRLWRRKI